MSVSFVDRAVGRLVRDNYYMFAITKEATSKAQDVPAQCQLICHILFSLHKATGEVKKC